MLFGPKSRGFSAEAFPINANDYTTIGGKAID